MSNVKKTKKRRKKPKDEDVPTLQTLGDYRRVAKEKLREISPYDAIRMVLEDARKIVVELRPCTELPSVKTSETAEPVVLHFIRLMEFTNTYGPKESVYDLLPDWPSFSCGERKLLGVTGTSYLEIAFIFVSELGYDIASALQYADTHHSESRHEAEETIDYLGGDPEMARLQIYPAPDAIIETWFKDIETRLKSRFPASEFSHRDVKRQFKLVHTELRQADGEEVGPDKKIKEPSKEDIQVYQFYIASGQNQTKTATLLNERLKPKKPYEQYMISRIVARCRQWLKANNLDVFPDEMTRDVIAVDPRKLDMRTRTDGRVTGDPRHKKKIADPDSGFDD